MEFSEAMSKTWMIINSEGRYILTIPAVNSLGWILIALGAGTIFLGIYLVVFTTRGIG